MTEDPDGTDVGCLLIVAAVCIGVGVGQVFGGGYGWLAAGCCFLLVLLIALAMKQERR